MPLFSQCFGWKNGCSIPVVFLRNTVKIYYLKKPKTALCALLLCDWDDNWKTQNAGRAFFFFTGVSGVYKDRKHLHESLNRKS